MNVTDTLRRMAGTGLHNLWHARTEVLEKHAHAGISDAPPISDAIDPVTIPSVATRGTGDRVLAEIDQDGFAFATAPEDVAFFDRRTTRRPRQQNQLHLVLHDGRVCVRKRFQRPKVAARIHGNRPVPIRRWAARSFWVTVKLLFYTEAAALLRLRHLPFVPKLRALDATTQTLYIDFVAGDTLRAIAARNSTVAYDPDAPIDLRFAHVPETEAERREIELLDPDTLKECCAQIATMAHDLGRAGVAPLDIKAGNFLRGATTGRLYWIDFEMSRLGSQPNWHGNLELSRRTLLDVFGPELEPYVSL